MVTYSGGTGPDSIAGTAANDTINGGAGNDTLIGDGTGIIYAADFTPSLDGFVIGDSGGGTTGGGIYAPDYNANRNVLYLNGSSGVTNHATATVSNLTWSSGQSYNVSLTATTQFGAGSGTSTTGGLSFKVEIIVDGTVVASRTAVTDVQTNTLKAFDLNLTSTGLTPADPTKPITLRISEQNNTTNVNLNFDDVSLGVHSTAPLANADSLSGGDGDDVILGGSGADSLQGEGGADTIRGGIGNDVIDGGTGADLLYGSDSTPAGSTSHYLNAYVGTTGYGLGGGDYVLMKGTFGGDPFASQATVQFNVSQPMVVRFIDDTADGFLDDDVSDSIINDLTQYVEINGALYHVTSESSIRMTDGTNTYDFVLVDVDWEGNGSFNYSENVTGPADGPILIQISGPIPAQGTTLTTTAVLSQTYAHEYATHELTGLTDGDAIKGGAGNDTIYGMADSDTLDGGTENDLLFGDIGDDFLFGGTGDDTILGGDGADSIGGGIGLDSLLGEAGNDTIQGDSGNDHIDGGTGIDSLIGGAGGDTVLGGDDADYLQGDASASVRNGTFEAGIASWTFSGTGGVYDPAYNGAGDKVLFLNPVGENSATGVVVNAPGWAAGNSYQVTLSATTQSGSGDVASSGPFGDDPYRVEILIDGVVVATGTGVTGNMTNVLTSQVIALSATGGVPANPAGQTEIRITELKSTNTISDNNLNFDNISIAITSTAPPESSADSLVGGLGNDSVYGNEGDDTVEGGGGDDLLAGDTGNDHILGGDGSDTIDGGADNDSIQGDAGDDHIMAGFGNDSVDGGIGNDSLHAGPGNDTVLGGDGIDTIDGDIGDDSLSGGAGTDTILGGDGADFLDGGTEADRLLGGTGNDSLHGGDGNDYVDAGAGFDLAYGDIGDDTLFGGADNDSLYGGDGRDSIHAGTGDDLVDAGADNDTIIGDLGLDTISGGTGADSIDGGVGDDVLNAGAGNDTVLGGGGNDVIAGDDDNDSLLGGTGLDTITGGAGADTIDGGDGNDLLDGGVGPDSLLGGLGNDGIIVGLGDIAQGGDDADVFTISVADAGTGTITIDGGTGGTDNDSIAFAAGLSVVDGSMVRTLDTDLDSFSGTFNVSDGTNTYAVSFSEIEAPICFLRGSEIATIHGPVRVEELRAGDRVWTRDHGYKPVSWVGSSILPEADSAAAAKFQPVRIRAGALGQHVPARDLYVSPQHRILVNSRIVAGMFGLREVLVPAKQLLALKGVEQVTGLREVEYFHLLFDCHEVVLANGAEAESLFVGPEAMKSLGPEARAEIRALFPALFGAGAGQGPTLARPVPAGKQARKLAARHQKNGRDLQLA